VDTKNCKIYKTAIFQFLLKQFFMLSAKWTSCGNCSKLL